VRASAPLIAVLFLGCKREPSPPAADKTPAPLPEPTQAVAAPTASISSAPAAPRVYPTEVKLEELLKEYESNEVRADSEFKGKLIRTFGTVGQVSKDLTGEIYVTVGTGAQFEHPVVQCLVGPEEASAAAALSKKGKVTVQGRVHGLVANVVLRDCVINPVAKFCERLRAATGGLRCITSEKTGDQDVIEFDDDGKGGRSFGVIGCAADGRDSRLLYDHMMKTMANPPNVPIGSEKVLCYGAFGREGGKGSPVQESLKTKIQAFFDAL
jgi:hypothetical protein